MAKKNKNNIQQFKCKECNRRFTRFTDTILEKHVGIGIFGLKS